MRSLGRGKPIWTAEQIARENNRIHAPPERGAYEPFVDRVPAVQVG
jgi:hypothetical protein